MKCVSYEQFCTAFDCLRNNEELSLSVMHNAVRDWIWVYFSYGQLNTRLTATTNTTFDPNGQWAAQELYSTLGMVIFSIASKLAYCVARKSFPCENIVAINLAGAVGIYLYDKFADVGAKLGETALKLSPAMANYFSAVFTGFEGPTQTIVITLSKLLTQDEEWTQFKNNPKNYLQNKAKELGISATLGLIPSALWQVIFNAAVIAKLGPIATCFLVAASLAVCNVIYAKTSKAILESECCTSLCGKPSETTGNPTDSMETQRAPLSNLFSFFGGLLCCGKNTTALGEENAAAQTYQSITPPLLSSPIN